MLGNDTLDGVPATSATVTATGTTVPAGLTLNADGTVSVMMVDPAYPDNPYPRDYELVYQICENAAPTNCATATARLTVEPSIVANTDDLGTIVYEFGGPSVASTISVLDNDTLDGVPVTISNVTLDGGPAASNTSFLPDGRFQIEGVTPNGPYYMQYNICETAQPTNCAFATMTVILQTNW